MLEKHYVICLLKINPMKKLFFFLFASMLMCSCTCLLSQIPPQYIYAGSGCTAPLPDYRTQVTVTGGCTGFTVAQTPAPGYLLTATTKSSTVVIKATGTNNKSSQIQFVVTMLDTITPKIIPNGTLIGYQLEQSKALYDAGDLITKSMKIDSLFDTQVFVNLSWDSAGIRKRCSVFLDSISFPLIVLDSIKLAQQ
jgi:hypothetical protein